MRNLLREDNLDKTHWNFKIPQGGSPVRDSTIASSWIYIGVKVGCKLSAREQKEGAIISNQGIRDELIEIMLKFSFWKNIYDLCGQRSMEGSAMGSSMTVHSMEM